MAEPAHVIRSDAEALDIAERLAERFAPEAQARDKERRLPRAELDAFSQSGLWGMTVPRAFGGAQVSYATVAQVFATIASADPSIAQIAQNHISAVHFIGLLADAQQKAHFLGRILAGDRFGNASSESGTSHGGRMETRLIRRACDAVIRGRKFYSTGALFARFVTVIALDEQDQAWVAILEQGTPGLTIVDDWDGFGQRTTASGTVIIEDVVVPPAACCPSIWRMNIQPRERSRRSPMWASTPGSHAAPFARLSACSVTSRGRGGKAAWCARPTTLTSSPRSATCRSACSRRRP